MSCLSSRPQNQLPGAVLNKSQKPYSYPCFLPAHLPRIAHHPLYADSQGSRWEETSAGLQSSLPAGAGEARGIEAGQQRGYHLKHTTPWVNTAGCHRGLSLPVHVGSPAGREALRCRSSTQSRAQRELGQLSVQILKETAAQTEENDLPAAKLAHLDKSVHLEIGCLRCSHGEGCCGHPWVQISPTAKLSCAALSEQKAEMSICGFIPVCLYPSLLQAWGWE